jgi:hypothetical protein
VAEIAAQIPLVSSAWRFLEPSYNGKKPDWSVAVRRSRVKRHRVVWFSGVCRTDDVSELAVRERDGDADADHHHAAGGAKAG